MLFRILILVIIGLFVSPLRAVADVSTSEERKLVAQFEQGDDSYDPFADYSEFDDNGEEEADINFFKHGRFFTLAFAFGYRSFTDSLRDAYDPSTYFGGYISYFFDLRFALQVGYITGDHSLNLNYGGGLRGNTTVAATAFHLKYFFNTQNVTRGLANLNPYLLGGFSQVYRTTRISGNDAYARDNAVSFDLGGGIEIPVFRNKMFIGLQAVYQLVNFQDEGTEFTYRDNSNTLRSTGYYPKGDLFHGSVLLGVNF